MPLSQHEQQLRTDIAEAIEIYTTEKERMNKKVCNSRLGDIEEIKQAVSHIVSTPLLITVIKNHLHKKLITARVARLLWIGRSDYSRLRELIMTVIDAFHSEVNVTDMKKQIKQHEDNFRSIQQCHKDEIERIMQSHQSSTKLITHQYASSIEQHQRHINALKGEIVAMKQAMKLQEENMLHEISCMQQDQRLNTLSERIIMLEHSTSGHHDSVQPH